MKKDRIGNWFWVLACLGAWTRAGAQEAFTFWEEACAPAFNLTVRLSVPEVGQSEMAFNFQDQDNHYRALISSRQVAFLKVRQGQSLPLGQTGQWGPDDRQGPVSITLQRRSWRMRLLCQERLVAEACDAEFTGGKIGCRGSSFAEPQYQPVEAPYFTDDFMRTPDRAGEWEVLAGNWSHSGPQGNRPDAAQLSANPFAYQAHPGPRSLSAVGYWFWDDYSAAVSVKAPGEGAVGWAVRVQDADHYYLFRWSSPQAARAPGKQQWIRVEGNTERVLAETEGGYEPGQWARLTVQVCGSRLQAFIDDQPALRAEDDQFAQGRAGLYAEQTGALFDDVLIEGWESFTDDFAVDRPGTWQALQGHWSVRQGQLQGQSGTAPEATAVTGAADWNNLVFGADVEPAQAEGVGLYLYYHNPQNYYLFRWGRKDTDRPYRDCRQWLKVLNGQATVLAETRGGFEPSGRHRLKVRATGGYLRAYIDNEVVAEAIDFDLRQGQVGFFQEGARPARFDNVVIWFEPEPVLRAAGISERFTQEKSMAGWATTQGAWQSVGPGFWHRGAFFGEWAAVEVPLPVGQAGTLQVVLHGDGANWDSGYRLIVQGVPNERRLQAQLKRAGEEKAAATVTVPPGEARLRFQRCGRFLLARLNEELFLSWRDDAPLQGERIGLQWDTWPALLEEVRIGSSNLRDYTFSSAPTDWRADRGVWEITDRWKCFPGWSWFGGSRDRSPILWSKRSFHGDLTLEFYAAIQMDKRDAGGYSHPSDINATICGDGRNLSSGYSFIFAGWRNTQAQILRGLQPLATNPNGRFIDPTGSNPEGFHHHWFYVRIDKRGSLLRLSVDDQEILRCEDPNPLPGGRIAFWTYRNGLLIARARIWHQGGGEIEPLLALPVETRPTGVSSRRPDQPLPPVVSSPTHPLFANDFEQSWAGISAVQEKRTVLALDATASSAGESSLKVLNTQAGNDMAIRLVSSRFNARQTPFLRFDYCFPPGLKLNVYAQIQRAKHAIVLTGDDTPVEGAAVLGRIPNAAADGRWHTAEFNLGEGLQAAYPNAQDLWVDQLLLANFEPGLYYASAGLGGTPWGVSFHLDNFSLRGVGGPLAILRWSPPPGGRFSHYTYHLDRRPTTDPGKQRLTSETSVRFEDLGEGVWYFHLRGRTEEGNWSPPVHFPLTVTRDPAFVEQGRGRGYYPTGLRGTYFDDPDQTPPGPFFTGEPVLTRNDPQIHFTWQADQTPGPGIGNQYWSARWVGKLLVPADGEYVFFLNFLDDAGRLWIDGKLAIDSWLIQPPSFHASRPLRLRSGEHDLRLEYHQGPASGSIRLEWKGPHFEPEVIQPASTVIDGRPLGRGFVGAGLQGQYWDDPDHNLWAGLGNPPPGPFFTQRKFEREDPTIDFQWGLGESPDERLTPQYWSARWTGKLLVPQTDDYTFYLDNLDDAGRLWIDGQLLIDSWVIQAPASHASPPVRLEAGLHDIKIEYHQAMALAGSIRVSWEAPSLPKEVIPPCFGGI